MIQINLLPVELRVVEVKKTTFSPALILWAALIFFLLFSIVQFFSYAGFRTKLHQLNAEWAQLEGPSREADAVTQTLSAKLEPEKSFLDQYILSDVLIAEVLNVLSNALPDSIWFSDLQVRREKGGFRLEVGGYSQISSKQIAVAQVQEYVNAVKSRIEAIANRLEPSGPQTAREVKVTLTTNLREVLGMDAMQFAVSFQISPRDSAGAK